MTSRPPTRALHVLDHSLPIGSGYSYRSRSIVTFQKRLGLDPVVLTSPKQGTTPSFARLIREAHTALRACQLKGGDRAIVRE